VTLVLPSRSPANEGANQVLYHNVREFGGLWLVVTSSGDPAP
jgi:hypothetical protein